MEDNLITKFASGVSMVALLPLALSYPTLAAAPHMFLDAYKNVLAVALATEYSIPQAETVKEYLKGPNKFDLVVAAPMVAESTTAPAASKEEKKEEPEVESDEEMGLGLFASGVSMVASLSLAISYPTLAAAPHMFANAYNNVRTMALATDYNIPQIEKVKQYLKDSNKFDVAIAAPMAAESAIASVTAKEGKKEVHEEEFDEGMGFGLFASGVSMVDSLSLALSYPTLAVAPHMFLNAYKNVIAVALATKYSVPQAEKVKEYLKDPNRFAASVAAPMVVESATAPASTKEERKEEPEVESDEEIGLGLFASGVSMVASLSLALSYPTLAAALHMFQNAYKNVLAVALVTEYSIPQANKVKVYLKDPKFVVAVAAPMAAESTTSLVAARDGKNEEPEKESDEDMGFDLFAFGVSMVASLSLALSYPTLVATPHMFLNAYKNVLAVALETEYSIPQAEKVKEYLKDPNKFDVAVAAPMAAESTTAPIATKAGKKEEPEEESDEDIGFDLFASGVSKVASLSLALSYPTLVVAPDMFLNAYKSVLNVALATEYSIPQADKVKVYLKDPNKFVVDLAAPMAAESATALAAPKEEKKEEPGVESNEEIGFGLFAFGVSMDPNKFDVDVAAPMAAESTTAPVAAKEWKKEEPEEESDEDMGFGLFASGVSMVASLSLALLYPTLVVAPHMFLNAYKNVLAVALETEYSIPQAKKVKECLKDPNKFVVAVVAPMAAESTTAPITAKEGKKEEPEEESDEDIGFDLFASGVSKVASLSLALSYPTLVVAPDMFLNAYKNVLAVALAIEYSIPQADKVKVYLKDPNKFVVDVAAPMTAESTTAPVAAKEGKKGGRGRI